MTAMPSALTLGGLLVALTLHGDPTPQEPLYTATVSVPEALVRSGPSDDPKMYPTNRLRQRAIVEVVKDRGDGWLEIKPPSGSFDWINTRFLLRMNPLTWVVTAHDDAPAPVLFGSELIDAKPTVIGRKAARGSVVVPVGPEIPDKQENDGSFLPIEPPPGEVRYIRADAVIRNQPPTQASAPPAAPFAPPAPATAIAAAPPAPVTPAGDFRPPQPGAPTTASFTAAAGGAADASSDPRLVEAQRLEQAGKTAEAAQKYRELAQQVCSQNHDLAMQCYNRAYFLERGPAGGSQGVDARYGATATDDRLRPVAAGASGTPPSPSPAPSPPPQTANYQPNPDPASAGPVLRSDPGQLRLAGRGVDGKRTYMLISGDGRMLMYVTGQTGVDLEPYVDRNVQLTGPLVYRMDVRAYHMTAQQATPLP
jgi:hypothetical protein